MKQRSSPSTFSIVARDPVNGDLGIIVQSKFPAVGAVVPWALAEVGAVASQAWANTSYGPRGIELMSEGKSASETLKILLQPEVLNKFADFIEITGNDSSMIERYKWFAENSEEGSSCRYARMAKDFFLRDHAGAVAEAIVWLYHNWAKEYEKGK